MSNDKWKMFLIPRIFLVAYPDTLDLPLTGPWHYIQAVRFQFWDAKVKGHQAERTRHLDHYRFEWIWDDVGH